METERKPEHGVAVRARAATLRLAPPEKRPSANQAATHDIAGQRVDLGVAHDTVGKLGIAGIPRVNLGKAAAQPLLRIGDRPPGTLVRQRIALKRQPGAGKKQFPLGRKMRIDRVPLHARALGDGADARARRSQLGVQINGRLDDAAAGFRLILGASLQAYSGVSESLHSYCTLILTAGKISLHRFVHRIQRRNGSAFRRVAHESIVSEFPGCRSEVIVGMIWGIVMAISRDHSAMPAHAHLNLLGWVSLFLFGIFYHLHPAIDRSRAALVQVTVWIIGTVVLDDWRWSHSHRPRRRRTVCDRRDR